MNFRIEIEAPKFDFKINYKSKILTLGSCFSDVVGQHLYEHKFQVLSNPFGNIYNLKSVTDVLLTALDFQQLERKWMINRDESFFHFFYHSEVYSYSEEALEEKIYKISTQTKEHLINADCLILTLGTSWIYEKEATVVSNCHKISAKNFNKRLLSYQEQTRQLESLIQKLRSVNPKLKVILTVSPVRHIKDGIAENNLSKSILRMICDYATHNFNDVYYFPSYEIMIDDLRDYRFYKEDMIHPTEVAEKYILQKFEESCFLPETLKIKESWSKIRMALNHRPFNANSDSHKAFLINLLQKTGTFSLHFDVSEEMNQVKAMLERT